LQANATNGALINEEQNVLQLKSTNATDADIKKFRLLHRSLQQAVILAKTDAQFATLVKAALTKHHKRNPNDEELKNTITQYNSLRIPWFKFFMTYDPTLDWAKLKIPVLALYGSKDTQVDAASNLPIIKKALKNNQLAETMTLPGLNHLFQLASTGQSNEYEAIEETINPMLLQKLKDWLQKLNQPATKISREK
jgi:pimeloyl-ACP methyl ester carboxylesterase